MKQQLIIFDFDGTLVDGQHQVIASMARAFAAHDLPVPDAAAIRPLIGLSLDLVMQQLAPEADTATLTKLIKSYQEVFVSSRMPGKITEPLFDGMREMLQTLGAQYHLSIATGKSRAGLLTVCDEHAITDIFLSLHTPDDAPSKPHPKMALDAMAQSSVMPQDCVMIGDSIYDMQMARAANIAAIGVTWGYHTADALRAAGADYIAQSVAALPDLIATALGKPRLAKAS